MRQHSSRDVCIIYLARTRLGVTLHFGPSRRCTLPTGDMPWPLLHYFGAPPRAISKPYYDMPRCSLFGPMHQVQLAIQCVDHLITANVTPNSPHSSANNLWRGLQKFFILKNVSGTHRDYVRMNFNLVVVLIS